MHVDLSTVLKSTLSPPYLQGVLLPEPVQMMKSMGFGTRNLPNMTSSVLIASTRTSGGLGCFLSPQKTSWGFWKVKNVNLSMVPSGKCNLLLFGWTRSRSELIVVAGWVGGHGRHRMKTTRNPLPPVKLLLIQPTSGGCMGWHWLRKNNICRIILTEIRTMLISLFFGIVDSRLHLHMLPFQFRFNLSGYCVLNPCK